jgi:hypothetical protein
MLTSLCHGQHSLSSLDLFPSGIWSGVVFEDVTGCHMLPMWVAITAGYLPNQSCPTSSSFQNLLDPNSDFYQSYFYHLFSLLPKVLENIMSWPLEVSYIFLPYTIHELSIPTYQINKKIVFNFIYQIERISLDQCI